MLLWMLLIVSSCGSFQVQAFVPGSAARPNWGFVNGLVEPRSPRCLTLTEQRNPDNPNDGDTKSPTTLPDESPPSTLLKEAPRTLETELESETSDSSSPRWRIRLPIGLKYAWDTVYTVWGLVVTVLGVGLSLGLVLNLMGYAYQIEPDGSLHIDTIEQIRTETQFRMEIQNSMKQSRTSSISSSSDFTLPSL